MCHDKRRVPAERAGALCQRLVEMQALGAWIGNGQQLEVEGMNAPLTARHDDNHADPRFNNSHIELIRP